MGSKDKSLGEKSSITSGEIKSAVNKDKETDGGMAEVSSLCPGGPATALQEKTQQTRDQGIHMYLFTVLLDKKQWRKQEWVLKGPREGREGNTEKGGSRASLEMDCKEPWELALIFIKLEACEEAPASKDYCRKEKQQKMKGIFMSMTLKNWQQLLECQEAQQGPLKMHREQSSGQVHNLKTKKQNT
ncbi:Surfeit locus protein 6 [Sciurus carolinensis]|uniref:Surfeit locus protein 6 n=1 Tax=Sciurus carolinensis TaxID=30640 RepID=A0AA41NC15_SCICA|nr:Surfeit locus protein 6 [Sciurus carolinensis]